MNDKTEIPQSGSAVSHHINTRIRENAEALSAALANHMLKAFAPDARKELRRFSAGETAQMLGISTSFLRKLHFDEKIAEVESTSGRHRHYSAQDVLDIGIERHPLVGVLFADRRTGFFHDVSVLPAVAPRRCLG